MNMASRRGSNAITSRRQDRNRSNAPAAASAADKKKPDIKGSGLSNDIATRNVLLFATAAASKSSADGDDNHAFALLMTPP
jgi:hypothetical protein